MLHYLALTSRVWEIVSLYLSDFLSRNRRKKTYPVHLLACTVCTWRSFESCCLETLVSDLSLLPCSDFTSPNFFFSCICKKSLYKQCSAVSKHCEVFPFASCFCSVFVKRPCLLCTGVSVNVNAFSISYCVFQHVGTQVSLQQLLLLFIYGKTRLKKTCACKSESTGSVKLCSHELISPPPKYASQLVT